MSEEIGNVVKELDLGYAKVRICDDYCRDKTEEDVKEVLRRIANLTIGPLREEARQRGELVEGDKWTRVKV